MPSVRVQNRGKHKPFVLLCILQSLVTTIAPPFIPTYSSQNGALPLHVKDSGSGSLSRICIPQAVPQKTPIPHRQNSIPSFVVVCPFRLNGETRNAECIAYSAFRLPRSSDPRLKFGIRETSGRLGGLSCSEDPIDAPELSPPESLLSPPKRPQRTLDVNEGPALKSPAPPEKPSQELQPFRSDTMEERPGIGRINLYK